MKTISYPPDSPRFPNTRVDCMECKAVLEVEEADLYTRRRHDAWWTCPHCAKQNPITMPRLVVDAITRRRGSFE